MHRPTLILRRFGAVAFGLGFFEDGAWVDHTTLPDRGRDLDIAGAATPADRLAVHAMLDCCEATAAFGRRSVDAVTVAGTGAPAGIGYRTGDTDVDAVAGRTSAL
jgi:hypothetical protein